MTKVYCPSCGVFGEIRRNITHTEPCWNCDASLKKRKAGTPTVLTGIPAVLSALLSIKAVLFLIFYLIVGLIPTLPTQLFSMLLLVVGAHKFCIAAMRIKKRHIEFPNIAFSDLQDWSMLSALLLYALGLVFLPLSIALATLMQGLLPSALVLPFSGSNTLVGLLALIVFLWSPIALLTYIRTQSAFSMLNPFEGMRTISADPLFIWFYSFAMIGVNLFLVLTTFLSNALLGIGILFGAAKAGALLFTFGVSGLYIRQNARAFDLPCDDDDWENTQPLITVNLGIAAPRRPKHKAIEIEGLSESRDDYASQKDAWRAIVPNNENEIEANASHLELDSTGEKWWEVESKSELKPNPSPAQALGVSNAFEPFDETTLPQNSPLKIAKAANEEGWLSGDEAELMEMYYGESSQNWLRELKEENFSSPKTPNAVDEKKIPLSNQKTTFTSTRFIAQLQSSSEKKPPHTEPSPAMPAEASFDSPESDPTPVSFEDKTVVRNLELSATKEGAVSPQTQKNLGQLGRYVLERHIASGGMAEVFLATQIGAGNFRKKVIVKRMLKELEDNAEAVAMFLDEASLAAHISHPNVVQILDFGKEGEHYYMALEYLDGVDVEHLLKDHHGPLPIEVSVALIAQACEGLYAAHTALDESGDPMGIVHRDISPSNLFLTKDGVVKILDFGIAQAIFRRSKTKTGIVRGKPLYMSPEQVTARKIDARADLFSLGATFYELLTGQNPFKRDSEYATLYTIATENAPLVTTLRPEIPAKLAQVLSHALRRSPAKRLQSANAFFKALQPHQSPMGSHATLLQFYRTLYEKKN